jgi:hypothetical protein
MSVTSLHVGFVAGTGQRNNITQKVIIQTQSAFNVMKMPAEHKRLI